MHRSSRPSSRGLVPLLSFVILVVSVPRVAAQGALADELVVMRVLDDFHDAAAKADFDRYFGHFARDGVFLGTDGGERWTVAEFKRYSRPYFTPGGGWTYVPQERHVSFTPDGATAFFDELLDNDDLGETRGSGVLVREDGVWKVAQYNLSLPIPNALADQVVKLIRGR